MNEISYICLWLRLQAEKSSLLCFFFSFFFVFYFILSLLNTSVSCPSVKFHSCSPPTCKPGQVNSTFYNVNITQMCLHFTCTSQDTACGGLVDSIRHLGELCVFSQGQQELDLSGSRNCPLYQLANTEAKQDPTLGGETHLQ